MAFVQAGLAPQKAPKEGIMDKILKGVQLANSIVGTVGNVQDLMARPEAAKQAAEAAALQKRAQESQIARNEAETAQIGQPKALTPADQLARERFAFDKAQAGKQTALGKQLPPDKVLLVNEGNAIPTMLQDIKATIGANKDAFGPVAGRLGAMNPYNEKSQAIQAQVKAASQAFGRFMEGGVLRKEDEAKYEKMFPGGPDTPENAANKLAIVERLLAQKQNSNLQALKQAGYSTEGLGAGTMNVPEAPAILSGGKGLSDLVTPKGSTASVDPNIQQGAAAELAKRRAAARR